MSPTRVYRGRNCWDCEVVGVALRRPFRRNVASAATWASAVERYRRAVERYHSTLRTMPDRELRRELAQFAGPLEAVLEDFDEAMANRPKNAPDRDDAVLKDIHRA